MLYMRTRVRACTHAAFIFLRKVFTSLRYLSGINHTGINATFTVTCTQLTSPALGCHVEILLDEHASHLHFKKIFGGRNTCFPPWRDGSDTR